MKRAFLLLLLLFLSGCTAWWQPSPPLTITATPTTGHPRDGGLVVTFSVSGGTGSYALIPGDGSDSIEFTGPTVQHVYSTMGHYTATIRSGRATKQVEINVVNRAPVVYPAFTAQGFDWMNKVVLDARYLEHGCKNGAPVFITGAYDPDGDKIVAYEWNITGPNGHGDTITYTVFDPQRNNITGQKTNNPIVVCFLGWDKPTPPYPFAPPMCVVPDPSDPPIKTLGTITFSLKVYDQWGGVGEKTWTEQLKSSACSR